MPGPVDDLAELAALVDARDPLLWQRRGDGLAGIGEILRLEFHGPSRFADAAAAWRTIVDRASVIDPLGVPGSGLLAFGAFAFSAFSGQSSVLIVPELIVGKRDGACWVTRVGTADAAAASTPAPPTELPAARAFGAEYSVTLSPGSLDAQGYLELVGEAIERINRHEVGKVVLARDLVGQLPPGADLRRVLRVLAAGYPDCWTYAVDGLVGSSPETLIRAHHGDLSARVLAGTISRGPDPASDQAAAVALATSEKDNDEHEFAVQSLLATLRPHATHVAADEVPFTLKLPNLWHLATDIEGTLSDGSTSLDLIAALHPTAAVAGTPTDVALALIDELEPFDRGRYAGPVGWVDAAGDGEWAIALRCAQIDADGGIRAYAGCGIVAESQPEQELAESRMKFRPMVDALL
ncbi:isochorismate synthase [Microterricola viridarii]|uniref:isochorismate synthase n=1 Tax=Microterricola viridarii TaxID=412690 RepID=A0A1H1MZ54_9MICO|nr:isochorismate synthase [Microterricola viridarii]